MSDGVTGTTVGSQMVHDPVSGQAAAVNELAVGLTLLMTCVFVIVLAFTARALVAHRDWTGEMRWIVGGGVVFPVAVLTALLVWSLAVTRQVSVPAPGRDVDPLVVEVTGYQWWWKIRYPAAADGVGVTLANEIRLPVGRTVEFRLRSADVIHSFWVPPLGGKVDMIPGRENRLLADPRRTGIFRGQCAEYCGIQHAWMALYVVVQTEEEFSRWLEAQAGPAREPDTEYLRRGRELFLAGACGDCHTVRGTPARGSGGPDLTHVGSRLTIGAGLLDNHVGTLAGWIAGAQDLKPGNRMPAMNVYSGEELRAVAAWLESLR